MKKIVSILLVSLILVQTSDFTFEDILKVKDLYEHAKFHQQVYGDNFLEFLAEHYGNKVTQHNGKHKEHKNLPLKHSDSCSHAQVNFTQTILYYNFSCCDTVEKNSNFFYKDSYSYFKKASIFQPPKQA
jgi:hypothetical protein